MKSYWQNYIDGTWVDGGAGRIDGINPGTGEKLAEQALADAANVDRAVMAAQRVHMSGALSDLRPVDRGRGIAAIRVTRRLSGDQRRPRGDPIPSVGRGSRGIAFCTGYCRRSCQDDRSSFSVALSGLAGQLWQHRLERMVIDAAAFVRCRQG